MSKVCEEDNVVLALNCRNFLNMIFETKPIFFFNLHTAVHQLEKSGTRGLCT